MTSFGPNYRRIQEARHGQALVSFTRSIAWLYVIGTTLFTLGTLISDFASTSVSISLPVQQFWPRLPTGAHITGGVTAHVTGGGFTAAIVDVSGLDVAARMWLAASTLLQGVTVIVIAAVVIALCTTILHGDPFRPIVSRGIRVMGITVIAGGLGWQICSSVAGRLASLQVLQMSSAEFLASMEIDDITAITGFPQPGFGIQVDFWPIWVGLALLALSVVFRHGMRLQRDTDGLV